jgi:hypothetical protein
MHSGDRLGDEVKADYDTEVATATPQRPEETVVMARGRAT